MVQPTMNWKLDENSAADFLADTSKILISDWKFEEISQSIKTLVSRAFGRVNVHFFGSRIIGLGTPDSDLDIFVDLGGKYYSKYSTAGQHDRNLGKFANILSSSSDWRIERKVLQTAVPIIITEYRPLGLSCKIYSENNYLHPTSHHLIPL
jgi:predicted nucleotidyltransferase